MNRIHWRSSRHARRAAFLVTFMLALTAWPTSRALAGSGSWNFIASPASSEGASRLNAVTAPGAADAWAVGTIYTTAQLNGIVYDITKSLTLHWNGAAWSIVPSPNPSTVPEQNLLVAIAAVAPQDVWAVGLRNDTEGTGGPVAQTLTMHWNGSTWTVVPSPHIVLASLSGGSAFFALSPLASSDIWAVGMRAMSSPDPDEAPLTAHWDGSSWNTIPAPFVGNRINRLQGVSARTPGDVWAVGTWRSSTTTFHILIEHWNGSSWSVSPASDPGNNDQLLAVEALAANNVWAVGERRDPVSGMQPLIMHWNGSVWSTVALAAMSGDFHRLSAIDAISPTDIWATGAETAVSGGPTSALLMHWDGSSWTRVAAAPITGSSPYMSGVAVVGNGDVWAVGDQQSGGVSVPLTERFTASGALGVLDPGATRISGVRVAPNPSRGPIEASFELAGIATGTVSAAILDLQGRLVRTLEDVTTTGDGGRVRWDGLDGSGRKAAAGVYLLRIEANGRRLESRIVRVR